MVGIEICGFPPLYQKTIQGWGTELFSLEMKTR